jgi:HEXXH motif-containing protein
MEIFNYLSTPFEGDFAALAAELAATQYRAFCVRALRIGETIGQGKDPLVADIVHRIDQRDATTAYWTPEVGTIFTGLRKEASTAEDWQWLRTQIALSAHVTGLTSEIALEVQTSAPLLICGRTIPASRMSIQGGPERLAIHVEGEAAPRMFSVHGRRNGAPVWADDAGEPLFIELDGEPAIRFASADWHAIWAEEPCQPAPVDRAVRDQFQECLGLLERSMPEYRDWIVCLLKEITPIRRPGEHMIASNSSALRLGGVDVAVPASPTETAEMLIHECSHQYFHMASWVGSTVTPDAKPHYSPLKRRERPLDRLLLGYHAFGNALIAFDRFRAIGLGNEIADRDGTVSAYMDQLRVPLQTEEGLSELGLALYRPLRARLAQAGRA